MVTETVRTAVSKMPAWAWQVATNADGDLREHADVVVLTDVLDLYAGTRPARICGDRAS